ncbi:uncharacterized protein [Amphiura filiformis]|uniref:uncharacterized protein isoform X1 n=1 Tax=Amphiura filiformis TaxID=82378 RepID=UPI003B21D891
MWIKIFTFVVFTVLWSEVSPQDERECGGTHYHAETTGIVDTSPYPPAACSGVPFFPDLEPNNRKCFWVKSGTPVAIFLTSTPQIYNRYSELFYQLELTNSGVTIRRSDGGLDADTSQPEATAPSPNLLTEKETYCIYVIESDKTIHLGKKDTVGNYIVSWRDTTLLDVNYILVQNYNDPLEQNIEWAFCDGAVRLLSQNPVDVTTTVTPTQRETDNDDDKDIADEHNAIDDNTNDGIFDKNHCIALGDELDDADIDDKLVDDEVVDGFEQVAWWRLDLQTMYHVKAVSVAGSVIPSDGYFRTCPKGWRKLKGACYYEVLDTKNWADAESDCVARGGHLATIYSQEVQDFLVTWLKDAPAAVPPAPQGYWIGLKESATTANQWEWADGTPGFDWTQGDVDNTVTRGTTPTPSYAFAAWGPNTNPIQPSQPSGSTQQCVEMRQDADNDYLLTWNDQTCSVTSKYICQISLCPDDGNDWILFENHCYLKVTTHAMDWGDAGDDCVAKGGHLATVNSAEKQQFLVHYLDFEAGNINYWIGLSDMTDGTYVWHAADDPGFVWTGAAGGAPTPGSAFTDWASGQPGGGAGQSCVELIDRGAGAPGLDMLMWNDADCTITNQYVCQSAVMLDDVPDETSLVNAEVRVGSCDHTDETAASDQLTIMEKNTMCGVSVSSTEAKIDHAGFWLLRECDYFGQFVYIVKTTTDPDVAWFSLCEVEVWGMDISEEDKPKVGFDVSTVSDLEDDLNTKTLTITLTDVTDHPTCLSFDVRIQAAGTTATAPDYSISPALTATGTTFECDPSDLNSPSGPTTVTCKPLTYDITFNDDVTCEDDETLVFEFTNLSPGLCAGDADAVTYDVATYNILADEPKYRWEFVKYEVLEGASTIRARLLREGLPRVGYTGKATTAYVTTAESATASAVEYVDYIAIVGGTAASEVVFGMDDTFKDVDVTILDDNDCELPADGAETFELIVTADDACQIIVGTAEVCIIPDDVQFHFLSTTTLPNTDAEYTVGESERTVEVVVARVGKIDDTAYIDVKAQPLVPVASAKAEDYTAIDTTTLTFTPGKTTASFTVTVTDDDMVEDDEIFNLVLVKNPLSLPDCALLEDKMADVVITDNDCNWSVMTEEISAVEDSGVATLTIICDRPDGRVPDRSRSAELQISSSGITDGTAATPGIDFTQSGTITVVIPRGQTSTTIQVPILDDFVEEPVEFFDVTLVSTGDGQLSQALTTRVTINDDDVTVRLTTCDQDGMLILESAGELRFTLERSGDLTESDSVLVFTNPQTTTSDVDFVRFIEEINFSFNQVTIDRKIIINDDKEFEGDETFVVQVRKQNQETSVDETIARCVVTIQDDDCGFSISMSDEDRLVPEDIGEVSLILTRGGYTDYSSTVTLRTTTVNDPLKETDATPGVDYDALSDLVFVTFEPGQTSQIVKIAIFDDLYPEVNEYFVVSLTGDNCTVFGSNRFVVGIEDNDEVTVSVEEDSITVNEDDGFAYIPVLRTGSLVRVDTVTLNILQRDVDGISSAATINEDFINVPITVTFDQGDDRKIVRVPIIDDEIEESGLESFIVRIKEVRQNPNGGISVTDATIDNDNRETVVYIRDDDGTLNLLPLGRYSESVGSVKITLERTGPTTEEQTVYVSTKDNDATSADYQPLVLVPVTFAVGATTASLSVNIKDDKILEGSEEFLVCWAAEEDRDAEQCVETVTIVDDDYVVKFVPIPGTIVTDTCLTVSESDGTIRLPVQREGYGSSLPAGSVTLTVTVREIPQSLTNGASRADGDGVDFTFTSTTLTFPNGRSKLDILVDIEDDEVGENQEAFVVELVEVSPNQNNLIGYPSRWTVCINDDDGGDGGVDGGGDDGQDDSSDTGLSRSFIVGIGGGLGLLVLIIVLGLMGCYLASRQNTAAATRASPRLPVTARIQRQPVAPPPGYYAQPSLVTYANPRQVQRPQSIRYN